MQNEFFGLKCGLFANLARFKALKSKLFANLASLKALKSGLFQGFKQGAKACRLGFMGLGAGFSPRKVGLQGVSSLSLSLSLSR